MDEKTPPPQDDSGKLPDGDFPPLDIPGLSPVPEEVSPATPAPLATESVPAEPDPMAPVKELSENLALAPAPAEAGYPFSLRIDGELSPHERAKLLDIIASANVGIREVDLEPQLESGRILIPRISEYTGILIVQALRGTAAELRLGPSDQIFSTEDTRDEHALPRSPGQGRTIYVTSSDGSATHPAERIPLTPEGELPGRKTLQLVDLLTASCALEIPVVEAEKSREYQEALESLTRELKFKAHLKGADAIVNFTVQLSPLRYSSQYRLTLMGSAVRLAQPSGE